MLVTKHARTLMTLAALLASGAAHAADGKAAPATAAFADIEIKLDDAKLAEKGAGIRVLYVTLYDANGKTPMPYGAMKVPLDKDAKKGVIFSGKLDANNVMVMGGGAAPAAFRIKARLDKDGSAGPDAAGDLVGVADGVVAGSKAVVTIDKAM